MKKHKFWAWAMMACAVMRAKDCIMDTVTKVQENAEDILAEAKQVNEDREKKEAKEAEMVDFSCALKLSMPVTLLSAMGECSQHQIVVKGGKFLEAMARAGTLVFDRIGTLTKAKPSVGEVIPFNANQRDDMLRIAACLEEHFPHSIARAVVHQAEQEQLDHKEIHADVSIPAQYVYIRYRNAQHDKSFAREC